MENINSSTLMKRLLAEYRGDSAGGAAGSRADQRLYEILCASANGVGIQQTLESSSNSDEQLRSTDRRSDVGSDLSGSDPAARLDALCLSTLQGSNGNPISTSEACTPTGGQSLSMSATSGRPKPELPDPFRPKQGQDLPNVHDPSGSRPPPPSYVEARIDLCQTSTEVDGGSRTPSRSSMSPRYRQHHGPNTSSSDKRSSHGVFHTGDVATKNLNALKGKSLLQFNGHPKSNSGGDEHLYTDSGRSSDVVGRKLNMRNIRGRKDIAVIRSRSLHKSHGCRVDDSILQHAHRTSCEDQGPARSSKDYLANSQSNPNVSRTDSQLSDRARRTSKTQTSAEGSPLVLPQDASPQPRHFTSVSAPSSQGQRKSPPTDQRRFSEQMMVSTNPNDARVSNDSYKLDSPAAYRQQAPTQKNSESVDLPAGLPPSTVMPQTPTASTGGYLMPNAQAGMRYYATNSATVQSMVVPGVTTPTHPAVMGSHAAPRRPPPPYPAEMMGFDQAVLNPTELSESSGWQPQRPNSLALGQAGKKKGTSNSLNSPTVTSPTSVVNSFPGTPIRGTPFYSAPKESPYTAQSFQPQQQQQQQQTYQGGGVPVQRSSNNGNGASSQFLRRTNSGRLQPASSSSSSTATSTPSYPEVPPFPDVIHRSPAASNATGYSTPVNSYPPDVFNSPSGAAVAKSDSMNSGTSSGSTNGARGIARRRKRNPSSRTSYPANTSGSGSSSNSGSRPNSNGDLTDTLEIENENLRNQLQVTKMKLKRFESLEADLQRLSEEHRFLHQSASKREALENDFRTQLRAKVQCLEKEKQVLKEQVVSMSERLKAADLALAKDNDVGERNIAQLYESATRKFAERERQLQDELDECNERLREQSGEIERLGASLDAANATIACLQEKFLQTSRVDRFTEQLSERLPALHKVVEERLAVEKELHERLKRQVVQRPLKSTSSNDEGISEMESMDTLMGGSSTSFADTCGSRDSQMLGVKAEMLKWQHKYLEQGLIQHVQTCSENKAPPHMNLGRTLRLHRHAISDPGSDRTPLSERLNSPSEACGPARVHPDHSNPSVPLKTADNIGHSADGAKPHNSNRDSGCCGDVPPSTAVPGVDCACQTPDGDWLLGVETQKLNASRSINTNATATSGAAGAQKNSEGDSPSEGYHSQQSSGSPTPNTESSAIHFPAGGGADPGSCSARESHLNAIRRNRSADLLTSLRD